MKIKGLIFCMVFVFGCASHEGTIERKQELIKNHNINNDFEMKPRILDLLAKANRDKGEGEFSKASLVSDYKKDYLISTDTEEKCELLISIAELDTINTTDFFIIALADPEPQIRREAAIQMKQMVVHPDVLNALILALDDKDDDVLIEVIEAVSKTIDERVLVKLNQISKLHSDQLIREVALDYARRMERQD